MNFTRKWVAGLAFIAASSLFAIETATVGYVTKTLTTNEWAIIGTQFQDVETQADININDLIKGTFEGATGRGYIANAPQVQVYKDGAFTSYYYSSAAKSWTDSSENPVKNITIPVGSSFWFKSPEDCDVTISGGCIATPTKNVETSIGMNLIANPYPIEFNLNSEKITWTNLVGATGRGYVANAPQVQVYKDGAFTSYYYSSTAKSWTDSSEKPVTNITIPAGSGFWFNPKIESETVTDETRVTINFPDSF